ncbi:MAG: hypothetical protein K2M07_03735 [Muribaculaceae bacterium]|nr:hypothetical protein [Muribaculaceae bacterium]
MDFEFDEDKAIEMMRAAVPAERAAIYTDDELLNVIDMIWDYYEENGMLEIDLEDEVEDEDLQADLVDYVRRMLRKDRQAKILPEDVEQLVAAELDYEESIF